MPQEVLSADPYNLIITGVGGQGNVLASRIVGNLLSEKGFIVTIGETFGASQRGGSVMSHLRISTQSVLSPLIPGGRAHMVLALEPTEALRVLKDYGNQRIRVITNTRPVYSTRVIGGEVPYPSMESLKEWFARLTLETWFIDATDQAVQMGNPVLSNVILLGALAGTGHLPLDRDGFRKVISRTMSREKSDTNLRAFDQGMKSLKERGTG